MARSLTALSAGATSALLVLLAARRPNAAGAGYGLIPAAIDVGAFLGPLLLLPRLGAPARNPRILFGAFGVRGLVDLVLATVDALPAAVAAPVITGSDLHRECHLLDAHPVHVPAEPRGRVSDAFDLIWQWMRLASLLLAGLLADTLGIRAVFYTGPADEPHADDVPVGSARRPEKNHQARHPSFDANIAM